jgi:hypothetical protein
MVHLTMEDVTLDKDGYWYLYEFLSSTDELPHLEILELPSLPRDDHHMPGLMDFLWQRQPIEIHEGKAVLPTEASPGVSLIGKLVVTFKKDDSSYTRNFYHDDDDWPIRDWRRYANMLVSIGCLCRCGQ